MPTYAIRSRADQVIRCLARVTQSPVLASRAHDANTLLEDTGFDLQLFYMCFVDRGQLQH